MNYPAASYGVSIGSYHNASRGGELVRLRRIKPLPASGGFTRLWRVYPPLEGLPASGGLVRLRRIEKLDLIIARARDSNSFNFLTLPFAKRFLQKPPQYRSEIIPKPLIRGFLRLGYSSIKKMDHV
jgi:hypothetical protein